jgi:hypothetical protein
MRVFAKTFLAVGEKTQKNILLQICENHSGGSESQ